MFAAWLAIVTGCANTGSNSTWSPEYLQRQYEEYVKARDAKEKKYNQMREVALSILRSKNAATLNIEWAGDHADVENRKKQMELVQMWARNALRSGSVRIVENCQDTACLDMTIDIQVSVLSAQYYDSETYGSYYRPSRGGPRLQTLYTGASIGGTASLSFPDPQSLTKYRFYVNFGGVISPASDTREYLRSGVSDNPGSSLTLPWNAPIGRAVLKSDLHDHLKKLVALWRRDTLDPTFSKHPLDAPTDPTVQFEATFHD